MSRWPRWLDRDVNLREVAPRLFIGDQFSPAYGAWGLVVDVCGSARERPQLYPESAEVLSVELDDGSPIPTDILDAVVPRVVKAIGMSKNVLLHCHMGLSRSASVAYAVLRAMGLDHDRALRRVKVPNGDSWPATRTLGSARAWWQLQRLRQQPDRGAAP